MYDCRCIDRGCFSQSRKAESKLSVPEAHNLAHKSAQVFTKDIEFPIELLSATSRRHDHNVARLMSP